MGAIGKISVRFFINRNVKALRIPLLGDSELFPLYVQVTFNRKNTQFRSLHQRHYMNIEDAFNRDRSNLEYEEKLIQQVVEYHVKASQEQFQLKGLKERYKNYTSEIHFHVEKYLRNTMLATLEGINSKYWVIMDPTTHWDVPSKIYYDASAKLINNFETSLPKNFKNEMIYGEDFIKWCKRQHESPRLIEWINDSIKEEYKQYLLNKGKSVKQIAKQFNFIDEVVEMVEENELV